MDVAPRMVAAARSKAASASVTASFVVGDAGDDLVRRHRAEADVVPLDVPALWGEADQGRARPRREPCW